MEREGKKGRERGRKRQTDRQQTELNNQIVLSVFLLTWGRGVTLDRPLIKFPLYSRMPA